ncbi:MAG: hypothetical protein ACLTBR_02965 [Anaerostipes sp.]
MREHQEDYDDEVVDIKYEEYIEEHIEEYIEKYEQWQHERIR